MRKLLFTTVVLSAFYFLSCNKYEVRHTVQYFISGKAMMNVSYIDASGELIPVNNVTSEWKYAFNAPGDKRILKLTVKSIDGSSVGGSILVDGCEAALNNSSTGSVSLTTQLP